MVKKLIEMRKKTRDELRSSAALALSELFRALTTQKNHRFAGNIRAIRHHASTIHKSGCHLNFVAGLLGHSREGSASW